ncbi:phage tail tape measure protein, partial [Williamsia deligens]|uniref:phage tail tape measure protein n=2 Tax=Williamsia deligens TaxID=321325 RepID=UPI0020A57148
MAELATAYISIVAETSGIPRQVRTALGATQRDADTAGRGVGRTFASSFGSSIKGLGAAAGVTGGVAGVAAAMKSAVTSGMDFTTSLNTLRSVASASSQQVAQVGAKARELGTDNQLAATSSVDAAQAMLELAKGGFTVDQSMQAARGTLQLAAAAQISAADAATIQSQALQAFGKDASFAGTASDILANAANQSSAEITDIANALQQGGAVANQFGLSMQDTAATVSLLANAGIQGSDAGTLLKSALLALTDTSKPAQAAMDDLGLTVYDAQGKFVGMESLFGQLQAASQRMTPQMYQQATATLFGSDAARIAGVAAQQGAVGFDKMRDAMGKQGAAAEVAAAKMNGLPGAWERFKNSAQDAGLAFYDAVQGPLTSAANWGADAIGKISDGASKLGPTVRDIFASISDAFTSAGGPEMVTDWGQRLMWVLSSLGGSAADLMPLVGNLFEMFGEASAIVAAVGIETFVTALETAAELLSATVVPVLQLGNSVLESMQPVVVGAIAAWLGWRLVGPALAGVRTQVTTLGATAATTSGRLMTLAMANRAVVTAGAAGSVTMGRFGSMIAQVGQRAPVVARMQQSFVQAAAGADRFGRSAGAVAAAGTGMRAAGAGIAGVFGGPVGLALTGAALGVTYFTSQAAKSKQTTEAYRDATKGLASAQDTLSEAYTKSRGAMNDDTVRAATSAYEAYRTKLGAAEAQRRSWYQVSQAHQGDLNEQADEAKAAAAGFDKLGLSNKEVAQAFSGTEPMYQNIRSQLAAMGDAGAPALAAFDRMRQGAILSQQAASRVKPGVDELGEAMRIMGDKGASAEDKLNALKAAMDAMNPARSKTEAMAQYGDTVRQAAEAVQQVNGTAFDQSGQLNAMTEAGGNLNRVLQDLADKSGAVATSGGNMGAVSQQNEQIFQQLAAQTGQSVESIRALYQSLGGQTVDLSVRLQGAPQVTQQLGAIS